jgi:hypothetical protein
MRGHAAAAWLHLVAEILRLANENDEFAQAFLDFYEAEQRYDEARERCAD